MARHVIIGGGAAGPKAAEEIRSLVPEDEVTIVMEDSRPPYYRYYLPDIIAGTKGEDKLPIHLPDFYNEQAIRLLLGKKVVSLSCREKRVGLSDGTFLEYDKLLIATGSIPRRGEWPGEDLPGVFYLRSWDEMLSILRHLESSKTAVVIGGGLLGIELAWGFRERGLAVTWLIRDERFWPQMMDAAGSKIMEDKVEAAGIALGRGEEVSEIVSAGGKVIGVRTTKGAEIAADVVGVAIGAAPSLHFLDDGELKIDRGILVDNHLRTNVEDVYAAGDIAQIFDFVHGDHRVHTNWENAERQGRIAGANMAGQNRVYEGGVAHNLMRIYDIPFVSMGLANPLAEGYDVLTWNGAGKYRKLVLKDGRIVGATMLGDIKGQRSAYDLIVGQVDVSQHQESLPDPAFSLASLVPKKVESGLPAAS